MKYKIIIILVIILSLSANLQAQLDTIQFERIGIKDGLSEVVVFSLMQDDKGFMWFGTQDGLNLYDGKSFKIFRPNFENPENSISSPRINSIFQSTNKNIWIGTGFGLNMYNPNTEKFHLFAHEDNDLNSITDNRCCHYLIDIFFMLLKQDMKRHVLLST